MALFPITRPSVGIHIGTRALTLVEVRRAWRQAGRGWYVRQCVTRGIPAGLVRPSPGESNIVDRSTADGHLRELAGTLAGSCVAMSLPDHCGRLALFDFESLPQYPAEVNALLRFRFQKDLACALGEVRLAYRIFTPPVGAGRVIRVLVAAVREDIMAEYEHLCEGAGMIPVIAGLSSLQLFDAGTAAMSSSAPDALFLHVTDHGLTFFAFQQGCPVFLRLKYLEDSAEVMQELMATLHYYVERYVGQPEAGSPRVCPLYVVNACGHDQTGPESAAGERTDPLGESAGRLLTDALSGALRITITMLDWNMLRTTAAAPLPRSGLPAVAALSAA